MTEEKKIEKKGKFRAKYVGPYQVVAIYDHGHKFQIILIRPNVEDISFFVPGFDLMPCSLDMDLTRINVTRREVSYSAEMSVLADTREEEYLYLCRRKERARS